MNKSDKGSLIIVNIVCVLMLCVIAVPLLIISKYNYPSADDWSYGIYVYDAVRNKEGIIGIFRAMVHAVSESYWEARFANSMLASIQPGVFGEKFYGIVAYLMIGSIILSEIYLVRECINGKNNKENRMMILPIIIPVLIMQILFCPSPEESFYWYTGAVNYTFMYSLSLILIAMMLRIGFGEISRKKYIIFAITGSIIGILIGGNNLATSLSTVCTLVILNILVFCFKRAAFKRVLLITIPYLVSFFSVCFSARTQTRIEWNFSGGTLYSPAEAVLMSLYKAAEIMINWRDLKVVMVLIFILPFIWKAVKNIDFKFKFPLLFTIISFGLFASQLTATMYVDGTVGGGRQLALIWYSYLILLAGNVFYWCGWLSKKELKKRISLQGKWLLVFCAVVGIVMVGVFASSLKRTTTYRAYRNIKQGWTQQYADAWEERIAVLKDDSVKQVEFERLPFVEMINYTDFDTETGNYWVNSACASYYGKEYIHIKDVK